MSLLPQRKKSPGEIAKLRESLGIPGVSPDEGIPAPAEIDTVIPAHHEATVVHETLASPAVAPLPAPAPHGPKPVHSLKRSERIPALQVEAVAEPEAREARHVSTPKRVRSLRKSEQIPIFSRPSEPAAASPLPYHRHSDQELNEIRRREAIAMMQAAPNPRLAAAHPALLTPGYLLALAGASCFYFYEFPLAATAACAATALLIAGFIFLLRPISRHHAAFIAVIALFVIVFGALHYFPQLQHAT